MPWDKFVKKKNKILQSISQYVKSFEITMFSYWFSWFFKIIDGYLCFFTLNILFDEVERGLGHEKNC